MNKILKKAILITISLLIIFQGLFLEGCSKVKESETVLVGVVTDVEKQKPVYGVKIDLKSTTSDKTYTGKTDGEGKYQIYCKEGYYTLKATKSGYSDYEKNVILNKGRNQEDFYISEIVPKPCSLNGSVVSDADQKPIDGATVQIGSNIVKTDKSGKFKMEKLPIGEFSTWVTAVGYEPLNTTVKLTRGINATTFKLKPLGKTGNTNSTQTTEAKRNAEYAISPSYLEDYKAHSIRIIYPENEKHEYWLVSMDRYTKHLIYDEYVEKGEILYFGNEIYRKVGNDWKVADFATVPSQPDTPIQMDLQNVLYFFNFEDPDVEIKEIGKEKMNGYNTRKFTIKSKTNAPKEKTIDVTIWIIDSLDDLKLNRVITRIKGKNAYDIESNSWAQIDVNFTDIGAGNVLKKPANIKQ